ncbi:MULTISPECIES: four-carbon acid sugar kinase family protein [Streptomyces]|uniref:four-carbon acid sugar kinase family protein n=1 Tax=Streptomyces TaxID=1883 RepID=UPI0009966561|nr:MULTISPECIES: four-carbon acid sugar kinase family protein [Streptomyces]
MQYRETLLVADDLSGAADSGIAFALRGMRSEILLRAAEHADGTEHADAAWPTARVLATDTDSRYTDPATAGRRVADVLCRFGAGRRLFKKLDSTLRGNPAAELEALRAYAPAAGGVLICAPASPRTGRTVRDGVVHVHDVPLHATDAWGAERTGPPRSVAQALAPLPVTAIPLTEVRGPRARLTARLAECGARGRLAVCDAESDADLRAVAAAGLALPGTARWAGAAGLAHALAHTLAHLETRADPLAHSEAHTTSAHRPGAPLPPGHPAGPRSPAGPVLAVIGSAHGVSGRQADALAAHLPHTLTLPVSAVLGDPPGPLASRLLALLRTGDTLLRLDPDAPVDTAVARDLVGRLGRIAAPAASAAGTLILTGGETARAVLTHSGVHALELLAEPAPSVVLARTREPVPRHVITKAGGFGAPDTLSRIVATINSPEEKP